MQRSIGEASRNDQAPHQEPDTFHQTSSMHVVYLEGAEEYKKVTAWREVTVWENELEIIGKCYHFFMDQASLSLRFINLGCNDYVIEYSTADFKEYLEKYLNARTRPGESIELTEVRNTGVKPINHTKQGISELLLLEYLKKMLETKHGININLMHLLKIGIAENSNVENNSDVSKSSIELTYMSAALDESEAEAWLRPMYRLVDNTHYPRFRGEVNKLFRAMFEKLEGPNKLKIIRILLGATPSSSRKNPQTPQENAKRPATDISVNGIKIFHTVLEQINSWILVKIYNRDGFNLPEEDGACYDNAILCHLCCPEEEEIESYRPKKGTSLEDFKKFIIDKKVTDHYKLPLLAHALEPIFKHFHELGHSLENILKTFEAIFTQDKFYYEYLEKLLDNLCKNTENHDIKAKAEKILSTLIYEEINPHFYHRIDEVKWGKDEPFRDRMQKTLRRRVKKSPQHLNKNIPDWMLHKLSDDTALWKGVVSVNYQKSASKQIRFATQYCKHKLKIVLHCILFILNSDPPRNERAEKGHENKVKKIKGVLCNIDKPEIGATNERGVSLWRQAYETNPELKIAVNQAIPEPRVQMNPFIEAILSAQQPETKPKLEQLSKRETIGSSDAQIITSKPPPRQHDLFGNDIGKTLKKIDKIPGEWESISRLFGPT